MSTHEEYTLIRGESRPFAIDFGSKVEGERTGKLPAGESITSATVIVQSKPGGASDPSLSSPTINSSTKKLQHRECAAGEVVMFTVTVSGSQTRGRYVLRVTANTSGSHVLKEDVAFHVV